MSELDPSLEVYRSIFREMISNNNPVEIDNNSTAHAGVIIQELIKSASESVYIFCSKLCKDIYDSPTTLEAIKEALKKGVAFHVCVRRKDLIDSEKCRELLGQYGFEICYGNNNEIPDFCLVDGMRWRIETDMIERTARVCAYNPNLNDELVTKFNKLCDCTA